MRRKIDDLGRVVIPAGIRRTLDIRDGDALEFTVDGDRIIIDRATDRCCICGHQGLGLRELHGRRLCGGCVEEVASLAAAEPDRGGPDLSEHAGDEPEGADDTSDGDTSDGDTSDGDTSDDDTRSLVAVDSPRSRLQQESADLDELRRELYDPASTTAW